MIHHIIVKWKENEDKNKLNEAAKKLFVNAGNIPYIEKIEIKENVIPRDNRYDLMIAVFMDKSALPIWDESELHLKWKEDFGNFIEKKCIFDCEEIFNRQH